MGYMEEQPSRMSGSRWARVGVSQGRDRPRSGDRGSGFFGFAPARCSDTCNSGRGYLESPLNVGVGFLPYCMSQRKKEKKGE